jgi:thiosulfate/3-mercaptopyruvate sulfurtransferase
MIRLLVVLLLIGCSQAPTKGYEKQSVFRPGSKNIMSITTTKTGTIEPIEIKPQTVVIDTRPPFVYTLSHLPGSMNMSWQEFTETSLKKRGMLVKDLFAKARRLARAGIAPESEVIVVGDGKSGKGEEARLAWTLRYLGVKNVEFVGKDYFDQARWVGSHVQEAPKANVPMWKPVLETNLLVSKDEIKKYIVKGKDLKPKDPTNVVEGEIGHEKMKRGRVKVIDSRPSKDYLAGSGLHFSPEVDVVNIEWTEFIDEQGRPDPAIISKLRQIGIGSDSRIIVLSQNGLESATVVMTLLKLGITDVGHVAGGIDEILGRF